MTLPQKLREFAANTHRTCAGAKASGCLSFADLCWGRVDPLALDPGIKIELGKRVMVFQVINGELRYYAGGWGSQENINEQPNEFGVLANADDAISFANLFLV